MGDPKFSRRRYQTPSHPWQKERIDSENELIKKYGLKNKRELWKVQSLLRRFRQRSRILQAQIRYGNKQAEKERDQLLGRLERIGVLGSKATLDDVLALDVESVLSRRLQYMAYLKGLSNSPKQARQFIVHGHVSIGERKVTIPGYLVKKTEEETIDYLLSSPISNDMHPARPKDELELAELQKQQAEAAAKQVAESAGKPKGEEAKPAGEDAPAPAPEAEKPAEAPAEKPKKDEAPAEAPKPKAEEKPKEAPAPEPKAEKPAETPAEEPKKDEAPAEAPKPKAEEKPKEAPAPEPKADKPAEAPAEEPKKDEVPAETPKPKAEKKPEKAPAPEPKAEKPAETPAEEPKKDEASAEAEEKPAKDDKPKKEDKK
ncbi:MAG: 30S ribosomal protein S4 [Thermoplasmata archaeon]|nr:30S ribosomal protein S4 [Thermoplasmata archaeon]